jgi:hypothetical protein
MNQASHTQFSQLPQCVTYTQFSQLPQCVTYTQLSQLPQCVTYTQLSQLSQCDHVAQFFKDFSHLARCYIFISNILIWFILEGVGLKSVGIFYGHFEYFTAIRHRYIMCIVWSFDICLFPPFGYLLPKNLATLHLDMHM